MTVSALISAPLERRDSRRDTWAILTPFLLDTPTLGILRKLKKKQLTHSPALSPVFDDDDYLGLSGLRTGAHRVTHDFFSDDCDQGPSSAFVRVHQEHQYS